ncbi:hypothetical protein [Cellulomonas shaoxiangyii]|uniref:Uncharacterized protein n=1 Tax=Cellulomonas shaoxiangyii TaxID=2566013 RepID=A0A4P7SPF1_9CELL|nr:hypothetical protein [Cellulomonas shaoxiangyii]QCB94593.1 hypothetical protein E5225_14535 [Cellulomonas shaoxiangyii]TGY85001.1 hypothetical protein E5226_08470 [Cellulomonas shaoxiangyii]
MTMPSTDERDDAPATGTRAPRPAPALPRRTAPQPVRERNRVALETLEATFAGLQQIDERARPVAPPDPPPDVELPWPTR